MTFFTLDICLLPNTVPFTHSHIHTFTHRPSHVNDTGAPHQKTRYSLIPTLIGHGHEAVASGQPLVARGDLFWPEHAPESASNDQYVEENVL